MMSSFPPLSQLWNHLSLSLFLSLSGVH
jgi:hypothetical protein